MSTCKHNILLTKICVDCEIAYTEERLKLAEEEVSFCEMRLMKLQIRKNNENRSADSA